jgi:uncharacterized protein (DUF849 family)
MKKLIIEVRANENALRDQNPYVPWTAEEIGHDVAECHAAGAALVHFHARTADGGADHSAAAYTAAIRAIRARCDILLAPSLANTPGAGAAERIANLALDSTEPLYRPDFLVVEPGSANLDLYSAERHDFLSRDKVFVNSYDTVDFFLKTAAAYGLAPYLTSFNIGWSRAIAALLDQGAVREPALVQLVTGGPAFLGPHPGTPEGLAAHVAFLPPGRAIEWFTCCHGGNVLALAAQAIATGGHVSIGLGDHPYRELGEPRNADLVRRVAAMASDFGRDVASTDEARAMLGLARPAARPVQPPADH